MPLVLDGTNGVSGVDGTASNPAIEGTDSNTGIFYPAADTVAIGTGGTERLRVDSSGNVGVGKSSAITNLDVLNNIMARPAATSGSGELIAAASDYLSLPSFTNTSLRQYGSTATGTVYGLTKASLGILEFVNTSTAVVGTNNSTPIVFATAGSERMRIDSSGNVGIGTSSPVAPLTLGNSKALVWPNAAGSFSVTAGADIFKFSDNNLYIDNFDSGTSIIFRRTSNAESMRIDGSGNVGIGVTPATTGLLELKAGTTSVAPLEFNAGTNTTSAVAGAVEYDGRVFYATPQGTQRGVVPGAQFFRLNAGLVGANVNTAQNVFGVGVTLSAGTVYAFELHYSLNKTAGTTSHTISTSFAGTVTVNNFYLNSVYGNVASNPPAGATAGIGTFTSTASVVLTTAITTASSLLIVKQSGTISVNAGGTFIPQYTLSAAPGGAYTTVAGSYMLIYPIGASGANTSVGTWA